MGVARGCIILHTARRFIVFIVLLVPSSCRVQKEMFTVWTYYYKKCLLTIWEDTNGVDILRMTRFQIREGLVGRTVWTMFTGTLQALPEKSCRLNCEKHWVISKRPWRVVLMCTKPKIAHLATTVMSKRTRL